MGSPRYNNPRVNAKYKWIKAIDRAFEELAVIEKQRAKFHEALEEVVKMQEFYEKDLDPTVLASFTEEDQRAFLILLDQEPLAILDRINTVGAREDLEKIERLRVPRLENRRVF